MKDESGRIIKFTLETPGYKHGSKSNDKHVLTEEQEEKIGDLWDDFNDAVWLVVQS